MCARCEPLDVVICPGIVLSGCLVLAYWLPLASDNPPIDAMSLMRLQIIPHS
jgi:hypothetical protein